MLCRRSWEPDPDYPGARNPIFAISEPKKKERKAGALPSLEGAGVTYVKLAFVLNGESA